MVIAKINFLVDSLAEGLKLNNYCWNYMIDIFKIIFKAIHNMNLLDLILF